jgi:hypothetical protein
MYVHAMVVVAPPQHMASSIAVRKQRSRSVRLMVIVLGWLA